MLEEEKEAENLVEKLFQDKLTELRRAKRTRKLERLKEKEDKKKRVKKKKKAKIEKMGGENINGKLVTWIKFTGKPITNELGNEVGSEKSG